MIPVKAVNVLHPDEEQHRAGSQEHKLLIVGRDVGPKATEEGNGNTVRQLAQAPLHNCWSLKA